MTLQNHRSSERRIISRFPVKSGLFALDSHLGPIIDISMNGLAFRYPQRRTLKDVEKGLGIIFDEEDLCFDRIPVKTVADFILSANNSRTVIRRCGVHFLNLSPTQKTLLKNFIWFNTAAS